MNIGTWMLIKDANAAQQLVTKSSDQGFWRISNEGPSVIQMGDKSIQLGPGSTIDVFKDANTEIKVELAENGLVARGTYEFLWPAPVRLDS